MTTESEYTFPVAPATSSNQRRALTPFAELDSLVESVGQTEAARRCNLSSSSMTRIYRYRQSCCTNSTRLSILAAHALIGLRADTQGVIHMAADPVSERSRVDQARLDLEKAEAEAEAVCAAAAAPVIPAVLARMEGKINAAGDSCSEGRLYLANVLKRIEDKLDVLAKKLDVLGL